MLVYKIVGYSLECCDCALMGLGGAFSQFRGFDRADLRGIGCNAGFRCVVHSGASLDDDRNKTIGLGGEGFE